MEKKKKILIFSFAYYPHVGGAEVAIKEITNRLPEIDFELITHRLGDEPLEERVGRVDVHRLASFTKYLYPFKAFTRGFVLLWSSHYDAMWAVMANTGFSALFLKIFFPKVRFVLTVQEGDPIPQIKRRVWFVYPFFKLVFRLADRVTAISNYLADFAKSMGARRVDVIPNGVDLKKFGPRDGGALGADEKVFLVTTGRLVRKNAVDDLIRALKFLPDNVYLRSVGSGEDECKLRSLVSRLGLENRVYFVPRVSHEEMVSILRESHIFIRPSLTEGLGNSFLEAMAVGLPIIGTRVGGIPDFLRDGGTGLFCGVRNPEDIADKVKKLMEDDRLYDKISSNARKLVAEQYDWNRIVERFEVVFVGNA